MRASRPRVAVVGHVEWVQFARVPHVPRAGEVVHAREAFEEPAGGGGVAAVQLARLAGGATLLTALGDDELGDRSAERLSELGVHVRAPRRAVATRRASTLVDDAGERTIVTLGPRLEPKGDDAELSWEELGEMDAVYFTAGDEGALRAARAARVLVASPRAGEALEQGVALDALVLSGQDAIERGMAAFDLGVGEARYKNECCEITESLFDSALPISVAGRVAAASFLAARRMKQRLKQSPRLFRIAIRARRFLSWPTLV